MYVLFLCVLVAVHMQLFACDYLFVCDFERQGEQERGEKK